MSENHFSAKMRENPLSELRVIVNSKDYVPEARQAAQWELEYRLKYKKPSPRLGEPDYRGSLESLQAKGELTAGKSYQEFLEVDMDNQSVLDMAQKVFKELQWNIIQIDQQAVLARRVGKDRRFAELVSFVISPRGEVIVFSQVMDKPRFKAETNRPSQAVKLTIHVFKEMIGSKAQ